MHPARLCLFVILTNLTGTKMSMSAQAEIYRWITPTGVIAFSDSPPASGGYRVLKEEGSPISQFSAGEVPGETEAEGRTTAIQAIGPAADELLGSNEGPRFLGAETETLELALTAAALPRVYLSPAAFEAITAGTVLQEEAETPLALTGTYLSEVFLFEAELAETQLSRASLGGTFLDEAHLEDSQLSGAFLAGACLRAVNLQGADLRQADLQGADLRAANLQGADLRGAHLLGTNLQGALLAEADLRGVDLTRVIGLTLEQLALADLDEATHLPEEMVRIPGQQP